MSPVVVEMINWRNSAGKLLRRAYPGPGTESTPGAAWSAVKGRFVTGLDEKYWVSWGNFMSIFYTLNGCFSHGFTAPEPRRVDCLSRPGWKWFYHARKIVANTLWHLLRWTLRECPVKMMRPHNNGKSTEINRRSIRKCWKCEPRQWEEIAV